MAKRMPLHHERAHLYARAIDEVHAHAERPESGAVTPSEAKAIANGYLETVPWLIAKGRHSIAVQVSQFFFDLQRGVKPLSPVELQVEYMSRYHVSGR